MLNSVQLSDDLRAMALLRKLQKGRCRMLPKDCVTDVNINMSTYEMLYVIKHEIHKKKGLLTKSGQ